MGHAVRSVLTPPLTERGGILTDPRAASPWGESDPEQRPLLSQRDPGAGS
jgi:hypothetical protein